MQLITHPKTLTRSHAHTHTLTHSLTHTHTLTHTLTHIYTYFQAIRCDHDMKLYSSSLVYTLVLDQPAWYVATLQSRNTTSLVTSMIKLSIELAQYT